MLIWVSSSWLPRDEAGDMIDEDDEADDNVGDKVKVEDDTTPSISSELSDEVVEDEREESKAVPEELRTIHAIPAFPSYPGTGTP